MEEEGKGKKNKCPPYGTLRILHFKPDNSDLRGYKI